jgi:hypothetical protein
MNLVGDNRSEEQGEEGGWKEIEDYLTLNLNVALSLLYINIICQVKCDLQGGRAYTCTL